MLKIHSGNQYDWGFLVIQYDWGFLVIFLIFLPVLPVLLVLLIPFLLLLFLVHFVLLILLFLLFLFVHVLVHLRLVLPLLVLHLLVLHILLIGRYFGGIDDDGVDPFLHGLLDVAAILLGGLLKTKDYELGDK